ALQPRPRSEWRFDGPTPSPPPARFAATRGFEAGPGVSGLEVKDGRLAGLSTSDFPLLHLERPVVPEDKDLLHEVEVRLRVSKGANLSLTFRQGEKLDLAKAVEEGRG